MMDRHPQLQGPLPNIPRLPTPAANPQVEEGVLGTRKEVAQSVRPELYPRVYVEKLRRRRCMVPDTRKGRRYTM